MDTINFIAFYAHTLTAASLLIVIFRPKQSIAFEVVGRILLAIGALLSLNPFLWIFTFPLLLLSWTLCQSLSIWHWQQDQHRHIRPLLGGLLPSVLLLAYSMLLLLL